MYTCKYAFASVYECIKAHDIAPLGYVAEVLHDIALVHQNLKLFCAFVALLDTHCVKNSAM